MTVKKPYFMENKEWYIFDEIKFCYVLTGNATEKAVESYRDFYRVVEKE